MGNYVTTIATSTPDKLIAGHEIPLMTKGVTLAAGQGVLVRGSVIGIITASGKGKLTNKESTDGSQAAKYILPDDIDTTDGDVLVGCYTTGIFNRDALTFDGESTAADHETELRTLNIFLKDSIPY